VGHDIYIALIMNVIVMSYIHHIQSSQIST